MTASSAPSSPSPFATWPEHLSEQLHQYEHLPLLVSELMAAAPVPPTDGWLQVEEQLFTAFLVVGDYFTVVQMNNEGARLSVHIPCQRVCRVATETRPDGQVTVTVELDADRRAVALNQSDTGLIGVSEPARYTLLAAAEAAATLRRFVATLLELTD